MIDPARVKERTFKALKSQGFQVKMYDGDGMNAIDPETASRFYVDEPNLLIFVDEEDEVITFNKNGNAPLDVYEDAMWAVKYVSREFMYKFTIRDYGKKITPKDFSYQTKKGDPAMESVQESAMYGSKKTSRQTFESVELVVKHTKPVDEGVRGARSRNIQSIFLESDGERFKFPHNNINGARAMARHLSKGGEMADPIGESIVEMTGKMIELKEFYMYTKKNKLMNESSEDVIGAVIESINALATDLKSLTGTRSYHITAGRIAEQETYIAEGDDNTDYKDMFTVKKFDEKYESILPMVSTIVQEKNTKLRRIEESASGSIFVTSLDLSSPRALQFESKTAKFGNRLKCLSSAIVENEELSEFIGYVAKKYISEGDVSLFERSVVESVLSNIKQYVAEEKVDIISESVSMMESIMLVNESEIYDSLKNEALYEMLSESSMEFYEDMNGAKDELMDLAVRLKKIQSQMGSVEEAARGLGDEAKENPTKHHFAMAVNRFNAARKGLGFANKLKSRADKSKHQGQVMKNLNLLRRDVEWLEDHFSSSKDERPQMPDANQFNKDTIWGER